MLKVSKRIHLGHALHLSFKEIQHQ